MNRKVSFFLVALLIGALSFSACKDEDDDVVDPPTPATGFTFGKVNNQWNMRLETGMFTDTTTFFRLVNSLGNSNYTAIFSIMNGLQVDTIVFYIAEGEMADYPEDDLNKRYTMVKKDSKVNDMFTYVSTSGDTTYRKIVGINSEVTVPAGKFSCFKIEEWDAGATDISTFYINPASGFIKIETTGATMQLLNKNF
jgi:hypothetical protein